MSDLDVRRAVRFLVAGGCAGLSTEELEAIESVVSDELIARSRAEWDERTRGRRVEIEAGLPFLASATLGWKEHLVTEVHWQPLVDKAYFTAACGFQSSLRLEAAVAKATNFYGIRRLWDERDTCAGCRRTAAWKGFVKARRSV